MCITSDFLLILDEKKGRKRLQQQRNNNISKEKAFAHARVFKHVVGELGLECVFQAYCSHTTDITHTWLIKYRREIPCTCMQACVKMLCFPISLFGFQNPSLFPLLPPVQNGTKGKKEERTRKKFSVGENVLFDDGAWIFHPAQSWMCCSSYASTDKWSSCSIFHRCYVIIKPTRVASLKLAQNSEDSPGFMTAIATTTWRLLVFVTVAAIIRLNITATRLSPPLISRVFVVRNGNLIIENGRERANINTVFGWWAYDSLSFATQYWRHITRAKWAFYTMLSEYTIQRIKYNNYHEVTFFSMN